MVKWQRVVVVVKQIMINGAVFADKRMFYSLTFITLTNTVRLYSSYLICRPCTYSKTLQLLLLLLCHFRVSLLLILIFTYYYYYFKLNNTQGSLIRGEPYHLRKFGE